MGTQLHQIDSEYRHSLPILLILPFFLTKVLPTCIVHSMAILSIRWSYPKIGRGKTPPDATR